MFPSAGVGFSRRRIPARAALLSSAGVATVTKEGETWQNVQFVNLFNQPFNQLVENNQLRSKALTRQREASGREDTVLLLRVYFTVFTG